MSRGTFKNTVAKALSKTQLNQKLCFKSEGPGIGRCSSSTGDNAVLSSLQIIVLKPLSFNVWSIDKHKRKKKKKTGNKTETNKPYIVIIEDFQASWTYQIACTLKCEQLCSEFLL